MIESINLLKSTKGEVLRADVAGQIMMKTQLSGMPECKLGLNDKVLLDKEKNKQKRSVTFVFSLFSKGQREQLLSKMFAFIAVLDLGNLMKNEQFPSCLLMASLN